MQNQTGIQTDARPTPLTLDQLHEDCLECIFSHINELSTQLQVARVCRRFYEIVARNWQRKRAYQTLNLTLWREWLPSVADLQYFLCTVQHCLTAVEVRDQSLAAFLLDLQALLADGDECRLPSVQRFDLEDMLTDSCALDEDVCALTKLLPNLKTLRLSAPLSGRYIVNFRQLAELYLYAPQEKSVELEDAELAQICVKLRNLQVLDVRNYERSDLCVAPVVHCERLTVLKLNLNALKPVLQAVLRMRSLKRLSVLLDYVVDVSRIQNVDTHDYKIYETVEFYEILRTQRARLIGIAADLYYLPLRVDWAGDLALFEGGRKLRKFAICNCDFSAATLEQYADSMAALELLCCRNWPQLSTAHVLRFVRQCPRLQHLDVSYCKSVDKQLLYEALNLWRQQRRSKPLHVYYLLSGLEAEVEQVNRKFWRSQNFIKLSAGFPPDSEDGLSYIQRGYEFDFE